MSGSLSATERGVDRWGPIATSKCPIAGIIRAPCLPDIVEDNTMTDPTCLETYLPNDPQLNISPVNSLITLIP